MMVVVVVIVVLVVVVLVIVIVTVVVLVVVKYYIWNIALYGAETWTIRAVDQKHLKVLKCGAGEGWKRSLGTMK